LMTMSFLFCHAFTSTETPSPEVDCLALPISHGHAGCDVLS